MNYFYLLIMTFLFWLIVFTKKLFFWTYLWQLKEYHIGRFIEHFKTYQGKKLILNPISVIEFILIILLIFSPSILVLFFDYSVFLILLVFIFQGLKSFLDLKRKTLRVPVLTAKTAAIISLGIIFELCASFFLILSFAIPFLLAEPFEIYFFASLLFLIILDFINPIIVSFFVLIIQPFAILGKWIIIKRAKEKRKKFKNLLAVGITGSYGKTSTKEFLAVILSSKFNVLKTFEHQNSEIGVSKAILENLKPEHDVFIAEMAAYNKGGIKLLSEIVRPEIGVITGVNEQHLALFGSMDNLMSAEGGKELIESLPLNGKIILNGNNKIIRDYYKSKLKNRATQAAAIICSTNEEADVWAKNIFIEKEQILFKVFSKDGDSADFKVNLLGGHNVENILMAAACAKELGMNLKEISEACQKIRIENGAMKIKKKIEGLTIIDSAYSANPDGVIADLEYLKTYKGKKMIIMPSMIELGKAASAAHQKIGRKIGEICDLAVITAKDYFEKIKNGALEKGMKEEDILFSENPNKIFERFKTFYSSVKDGDSENVLLLEGRIPKELVKLLDLSDNLK